MLGVNGGGGAVAADAALRRRRGKMNWDAGRLTSVCCCLMWRVAAHHGLASQGIDDGWPPRGGEVLKMVGHCSIHSVKPSTSDSAFSTC